MTGPFNGFAGVRVTSGTLVIPLYGLWAADVQLADLSPIPATGALTLGDLSLVGTVQQSLAFAGLRTVRLVGGTGGWNNIVPARAYANSNGVPLSMVLGDVAKDCGETIKVTTDSTIGNAYVRESAPASRTLRSLAGSLWWVDPSGTTRVGPRDNDGTPVDSVYEILSASGSDNRYVISTDAPGEWLPGRTFSGPTVTTPAKVSMVTHSVTGAGKARVEVLAA